MPPVDEQMIGDLEARLRRHLKASGITSEPKRINAGGSAAVFAVATPGGQRAFKVFDPRLLSGALGPATRRRLDLQRTLVGHDCESLVVTYNVVEAEGTAIIEMELCEWPQLSASLGAVPDDAVAPLISKLAAAVRFLEDREIVHRDIKPENIHVSADFKNLKLLDLGVARTINGGEQEDDAARTDQEQLRPFVATAQYSSPEYLFRLDEPTPRLWRALNIYQVGAVLHDLITKSPIFAEEVGRGNRWLVARAVLTKAPSLADGSPNRLTRLKALCARCLAKNIDTRLSTVDWAEFGEPESNDPLSELERRLGRRGCCPPDAPAPEKLRHARERFVSATIEGARRNLIDACGPRLLLTVIRVQPEEPPTFQFEFSRAARIKISATVRVEWAQPISPDRATIFLGPCPVCEAATEDGDPQATLSTSRALAEVLSTAIDLIEAGEIPAAAGATTIAGGRGMVEVTPA